MSASSVVHLRELISRGAFDEILAETGRLEAGAESDSLEIADIRSLALAGKGDFHSAINTLESIVSSGTATFHIYYRLAEHCRNAGNVEKSQNYYRRAHAEFGWRESLDRGYVFSHDYFSPNIPFWEHIFSTYISAAPLNALEIGSWQGGSATWLLDKVLVHRGGSLTCIDAFEGSSEHANFIAALGDRLENIFDRNIGLTGQGHLVRKLVGYSQRVLPRLHGEEFDLLYIDGAHEAKFVIQDAVLCWGLTKKGGYILFDDVGFEFPSHPEQNTTRAIDFFLSVFSDEIEVVESRHQLLVKRVG